MVVCSVCSNNSAIYKCPKCLIRYCSSNCFKTHNCEIKNLDDTGQSKPQETTLPNVNTYRFITEDTVPLGKLKLLNADENVRNILGNPHVRDILKAIDGAPNPEDMIQKAMLEPIFVEFADACLKVVEPNVNTDE